MGKRRFQVATDASFDGGRVLGRVFVEHRRHAGTEVVNVTRQHQQGIQVLRQIHAQPQQGQGLLTPIRIARVDGIDHHAGPSGPICQLAGCGKRRCQMNRSLRQRDIGLAARLRQYFPAGRRECGYSSPSEAPVGTQDQNGFLGMVHRRPLHRLIRRPV